jgi:rhodanese-related sulfurtransferase
MDAEPIPSISATDAAADAEAVLLDVRERDEWIRGRALHAAHIPMGEVVARVAELDRDRRIVCVCRSGNRSARVTQWLRAQGYDAVNLSGGMNAWAAAQQPLVNEAGNPGIVI